MMMGFLSLPLFFTELLISLFVLDIHCSAESWKENVHVSVLGDPGMKSPNARLGLEAWNFCNEVGMEAQNMGSPRMADCADLNFPVNRSERSYCEVHHRVNEKDNHLKVGDEFPVSGFRPYMDPDKYAVEKELYLGSLCEASGSSFWMIMLKNGNFDKNTTLCPENGKRVDKITTNRTFPCFGQGCMSQPLVYHNRSKVGGENGSTLTEGFHGTYDLGAKVGNDESFFEVSWQKNSSSGSWIVSQKLTTSSKYPWQFQFN